MAITTSPAEPVYGQNVTITITGLTANTKYLVAIGHVGTESQTAANWSIFSPSGRIVPITSDNGGNATVVQVVQAGGVHTVNVYLQPVLAAATQTATYTSIPG